MQNRKNEFRIQSKFTPVYTSGAQYYTIGVHDFIAVLTRLEVHSCIK
jgi:hypothetical protein